MIFNGSYKIGRFFRLMNLEGAGGSLLLVSMLCLLGVEMCVCV